MRPAQAPWVILLAAAATVALPWLWPWAPPPIPAVPGLLSAWGLTALLWGLSQWPAARQGPVLSPLALTLLMGLVGLAAWRMPFIDLALLGGLFGSGMCVLLASQCVRHGNAFLLPAIGGGVLAAASLSAILGLLQYGGLLREPHAVWSWLHASPGEEAYGQLRQRNQLGSLMALGLAAWCYLAHLGWTCRVMRLLAWVTLALLSLGAAASSSRTGALAWVGLCLLTLVWPTASAPNRRGPSARQGALVALGAFLLLSGLLPWLAAQVHTVQLPKASAFERLVTQSEGMGVCESRLVLWRHVLALSIQQPWMGWGFGELDFAHATQTIPGERFCGQLGHAHNLLLHLAVEWGWPLTLLGVSCAVMWVVRRQPWQARHPLSVLGWSWLGVIGLHSGLEFPLWYGPFQMILGLAVGGIIVGQTLGTPGSSPNSNVVKPCSSGSMQQIASRVVVALGLCCCAWAGWDYHRVSQVFQPAVLRSEDCRTAPQQCLNQVVWFHQARDFALLRQAMAVNDTEQAQALAIRVAHFAPEAWVLAQVRVVAHPK